MTTCDRCDRCNGFHPSAECPHFQYLRGEHPDAKPLPPGDRPLPTTASTPQVEAGGRLIKQPADGSCLYHALSHGAGRLGLRKPSAPDLRRSLAQWARDNERLRVAGKTLRTWLHWETGGTESFASYVAAQAESGWGGVLENNHRRGSSFPCHRRSVGAGGARSLQPDRRLRTRRCGGQRGHPRVQDGWCALRPPRAPRRRAQARSCHGARSPCCLCRGLEAHSLVEAPPATCICRRVGR